MLNKMFDEFNNQYGLETKDLDHNLEGFVEVVGSEYDEMRDEMCEIPMGGMCLLDEHNFVKEGMDLVYATLQQLRERGVDVDSALAELHRSNMSKRVVGSPSNALVEARKRYPNAEIVSTENGFVIKCSDTGKVVKLSTYSPAVITDAMIGKE